MSEWLKEHAWKAISASRTERYRQTFWHNRFSDFAPHSLSPCDFVIVGISRRFRVHLTHFLHSFRFQLSLRYGSASRLRERTRDEHMRTQPCAGRSNHVVR